MRLFEHQAKRILAEAGIAVPEARLIYDPEEAGPALEEIGPPCLVKAQILKGGRGRAGLIQLASSPAEARAQAQALLAASGVHGVLMERRVMAERELYLSAVFDPVRAQVLLLASARGGMEIEELARRSPEKIFRQGVDPRFGLQPFQARELAFRLDPGGGAAGALVPLIAALYKVFTSLDAELAEINPLFLGPDRSFIAGDAKILVDDHALFRHPELKKSREQFSSDLEYEAHLQGIPFLQFEGEIALMCAGAGLTNTVFDLIHDAGGRVASYLEFGGPNYRKAQQALELTLKSPSRVILIVTFGTIARADVMAEGLIEAIARLRPDRPIVACLRGTGEERAVELLRAAGLEPLDDTEEAVRRAVAIAGETAGRRG